MRQAILIALSAVTLFGGVDRLVVHRAQIGSDVGKVVITGGQLIFVDDTDPAGSFSMPRADILSLREDNGLLGLQFANGWITLMDPASTTFVASWTGLPLNTAERVTVPPADGLQFNIRHDDDYGRLVIGNEGLTFDALSNARKSRRWLYSDIQEFKHDVNDREFKIRTYGGEEFKFRVLERDISNDVYNMVADRIVSARRP